MERYGLGESFPSLERYGLRPSSPPESEVLGVNGFLKDVPALPGPFFSRSEEEVFFLAGFLGFKFYESCWAK